MRREEFIFARERWRTLVPRRKKKKKRLVKHKNKCLEPDSNQRPNDLQSCVITNYTIEAHLHNLISFTTPFLLWFTAYLLSAAGRIVQLTWRQNRKRQWRVPKNTCLQFLQEVGWFITILLSSPSLICFLTTLSDRSRRSIHSLRRWLHCHHQQLSCCSCTPPFVAQLKTEDEAHDKNEDPAERDARLLGTTDEEDGTTPRSSGGGSSTGSNYYGSSSTPTHIPSVIRGGFGSSSRPSWSSSS